MYLVKTPWWLRALYPALTWRVKNTGKTIYLSFDDGPHETATPFVLEHLRAYNAKATFFCIGKNVGAHPSIYQNILDEGHSIGNHTFNHLNGWKVTDEKYIEDITKASALIKSNLFRPPYGRIKYSQQRKLRALYPDLKVIMWDVLSGDFDTNLNGEACLGYVMYHSRAGSIIVFHDSEKAWERMRYALPKVLEYFSERGFEFRGL